MSISSSKSLSKVKEMLRTVPNKKTRYFQDVPEVQKSEVPIASYKASDLTGELVPIAVVPEIKEGTSMFPSETVVYKESYRDMVVSNLYEENLLRPLPLFFIAIGFTSVKISKGITKTGLSDAENSIIPLTLHYGPDKTGPILGFVESIERNTKATILNTVYDPTAEFKTTILDIGALLSLCSDRVLPDHDWCLLGRENERGMCLFRIGSEKDVTTATNVEESKGKFWNFGKSKKPKLDDGEVLAVFVAGKSHSWKNPVKVAARIRWCDNEVWSEQLKLAAFLAIMTFGEKSRRVGTGGGL
ncbi:uncharacterized protein RAG0_10959 [Rhynchosporium agropyri]|uniref:Uncharacterized protein n=1 Tax=Rhynchosporium agropyri TaxID=914238 RepID=A0A1E1L231_9HELO|nr:uncharacterized protein RAG0_10959 [Rhynchosporium agropyri]